MTAEKDFADWIESELAQREWRPADLARVAGIDSGQLSRILNRMRRAGPDTCLAIARALKVPPEKVFRQAGLLPPLPAPEDSIALQELLDIVQQLSPEEQRGVLEYALWRYRRQERR